MTVQKRRVLWLLNHTTLRECEVPLLIQLGFEVFTPKVFKWNIVNRSGSAEYKYDETLTIPKKVLDRLNKVDFYTQTWSKSLTKVINQYFDIAICGFFPKMVEELSANFAGQVFLRAFGIVGDTQYSEWFTLYCSEETIKRVQCADNIWFAPSYDNIIDNEPNWLRKKSVFLPLGLPAKLYKAQNTWEGTDDKVLFVCPNINDYQYYKDIYLEFKRDFGHFSHVIAGQQPVPVDDPSVTGFLPDAQYQKLMRTCSVMYYHSREQTHLHYHPLEVILAGMPLIYMSGGMLDYLAGEKLPGCADSIPEAEEKIRRILNRDESFIQQVRESQQLLLEPFSGPYIESVWRKNFLPIIETIDTPVMEKVKGEEPFHLGIWIHLAIPEAFGVEGIMRLLAFLIETAQERGDVVIKIACLSWVRSEAKHYLEQLGVASRRIEFISINERPPLLYYVYKFIMAWGTPGKPGRLKRFIQRMLALGKQFGEKLAPFKSTVQGSLKELIYEVILTRSIFLLFFIAVILVIFSPVLLVFALLILLGRGFRIGLRALGSLRRIRNIRNRLSGGRFGHFLQRHAQRLFKAMGDSELRRLVDYVNQHHPEIDSWYFPYPRNPFITRFKRPVIVAVPDIVYFDFPVGFQAENTQLVNSHLVLADTIRKADRTISYSEYVRENHIIKRGYLDRRQTYVIPHAPIDSRALLTRQKNLSETAFKEKCRNILKTYLYNIAGNSNDPTLKYLKELPIGEIPYLFVSSQTRIHKNHLNVIRALEKLLHERFINIKLVITGRLFGELGEYVTNNHLYMDVISLSNLPPRVHAAFYACASLAVIPTLFEGGLPFVFSEALSVGTPVVMSDIPVVREVLVDPKFNPILFDPYNVADIADKIQFGLENRQKLLDLEMPVFDEMKSRSWNTVANEYLGVIKKMSRGESV